MKRLTLLFAICAGAASYSQDNLQDIWFVAPDNSLAPDALPTAKFKSPLFSAPSGGERIYVNDLNGDLSAYHILFDGSCTTGKGSVMVLWGGNGGIVPGSENYKVGAITVKNYKKPEVGKFYTEKGGYYKKTTLTVNADISLLDNNPLSTFRIGESFNRIDVNGSILVKNSRFSVGGYTQAATTAKARVKGNVEMAGTKAVFFNSIGGAEMGTFENPDLKIDGVVKMSSANNKWLYNSTRTERLLTYISVGGISGGGKIVSDAIQSDDDKINSRSVIALTPKDGEVWDFRGNISSGAEAAAISGIKKRLDIEMRGLEGGSQILRISKDQNAYMDGNITVYGGTLFFSNTSDLRTSEAESRNLLILEGGRFAAASQSVGNVLDKAAYFNGIIWNGGVIIAEIIDMDIGKFSSINAASLTLGNAGAYNFEFVNKNDEDLSGVTLKLKDFFNISGGISAEQIEKLGGKTVDGKWKAVFNAKDATVSFERL